jgi:hypothetical protein
LALHWSIARVKDWKDIAEDDEQRKITEAIVWAALVYDLSGIAEKNIGEWLFRQEFAHRVDGYHPLYRGVEPSVFTRAELERRIGLSTNVTTTSRAAFHRKSSTRSSTTSNASSARNALITPVSSSWPGCGRQEHPAPRKSPMQPMKLADVRKHTGRKLTYAEAMKIANPGDRFLRNMAVALSLHAWNNTPEDWLRLEAALVILRHKPRRTPR